MGDRYLLKTDEELLRLIAKADQTAFEVIFNKYYPDLCKFISIYLKDYTRAEELVSDLFIKIWDKRNDLRIHSLRQYLFTSARHLSLNELQKVKLSFEYLDDDARKESIADLHLNPHDLMVSRESYGEIVSMIDRLPVRQREVLLMSRIDHLDKNHIAELLNISVRTVETLLYQSIKSFRILVSGSDQRSKI